LPRPLAVAVTGGIGAGKSEALAAFARHGAAVASADELVHRLLRRDRAVQAEVLEAFGVEIRSGSADERTRLAEAVFGDPERLERLERLLHPRVRREQRAWLEELRAQPRPPALAVVEIPLLFETGAERGFDAVVAITAPKELRARRKELTRLEERERRLLPDEEKTRRADFSYVNDGTTAELDAFVGDVVARLEERLVAESHDVGSEG
jgi:dephospho-CoA kinase